MQNRRGLILIGLALVMGITAAWFTQRLISEPTSSPASVRTLPVVVVRSDVPVATSLSSQHLDTFDWPADHVPRGAVHSADQLVGRVARRPIAAGEPVLEMALFDAGTSGGLPALIADGRRAITVKVDNIIGVAGFVQPGARVDVMATLRRVDKSDALPYSKIILQNIRVLAADQKLEQATAGDPEIVSMVTLEVDPTQAERLLYASHEGRLQLAMRSPSDDAEVVTTSAGVREVLGVSPRRVRSTRTVSRASVEVLNGTQLETQAF
jgi:pilus assembly protein CpaB